MATLRQKVFSKMKIKINAVERKHIYVKFTFFNFNSVYDRQTFLKSIYKNTTGIHNLKHKLFRAEKKTYLLRQRKLGNMGPFI